MIIFILYNHEAVSVKLDTWHGFQAGKVTLQYANLLGYRKGADGNAEIDEEQAKIVRDIYRYFLNGWSLDKIKNELESQEILTVKENKTWTKSCIRSILQNEKYKGDVLLQKTYVSDLFSKKAKKNNGELPQYLVKNHHEPIIPPDIFDSVQAEFARRNTVNSPSANIKTYQGKYSGKYALSALMVCGECGTKYRRVTWSKRGKTKVVWRCTNRHENGTKYCKHSPTIEEEVLHNAIVNAINNLESSVSRVKSIVRQNLAIAMNSNHIENEILEYTNKIEELNRQIVDGIRKYGINDETDKKCSAIYQEIQALKNKIKQKEMENKLKSASDDKLKRIFDSIDKFNGKETEYNDDHVRNLISSIKVLSENEICISFGGLEINQRLYK